MTRSSGSPARHSGGRGLSLRDRRLSEPAQQHRHPRPVRVRAQHRRLAQRPLPLQCQHAEPAQRHRHHHPPRRRQDDQSCTPRWTRRPPRRSASSREPWAIAFKNSADEGYVVSAASNIVVKVRFDPSTGAPTVQNDPARRDARAPDPHRQESARHRVNSTDTTAYVMNYVSRDVTVIDLTSRRGAGDGDASLGQPTSCRHGRG